MKPWLAPEIAGAAPAAMVKRAQSGPAAEEEGAERALPGSSLFRELAPETGGSWPSGVGSTETGHTLGVDAVACKVGEIDNEYRDPSDRWGRRLFRTNGLNG